MSRKLRTESTVKESFRGVGDIIGESTVTREEVP